MDCDNSREEEMKGFYLWDWFETGSIKFDSDIEFQFEEYAKTQGCFRRFDDCKRHGLNELEDRIDELHALRDALKKLTVKDVKK